MRWTLNEGIFMKHSQKLILHTETLPTAKSVIPAKAGIQKNTGFRIKSGMTNYIRSVSLCIVITFITTPILLSIALFEPVSAHGQSMGKIGPFRGSYRDPFVFPPGVRLLSKNGTPSVIKGAASSGTTSTTEIKPIEIPLRVNAILISEHSRLASIDRHIVTVGDSIHDEKILEIEKDRVIVGKGDKKRTLLLSQSPVQLTVEEK